MQEFLDSSNDEGSESGENSVDLGSDLALDQTHRHDHDPQLRLDPTHHLDHDVNSPDCLQDHLARLVFSFYPSDLEILHKFNPSDLEICINLILVI